MQGTIKHSDILAQAIKTVCIGRKGSKELSPELIDQLPQALEDHSVSEIAKGAFWGGLLMKGLTDNEKELLAFPETHLNDAPFWVNNLTQRLLEKQTMTVEEAEAVGDYLFSDSVDDFIRGMIASILRVRYETDDEYEGLLKSMSKTFRKDVLELKETFQRPLIQIADPFDGHARTNMITPVIAKLLSKDHGVVVQCGRNSGPKFGNNLYDYSISNSGDEDVFYLSQDVLSPKLDQWVDHRHQIIKRPFLATLERFVNPFEADILIASAFHPPYGEKMLTIAERAGFKKVIIIRNGMEGTIAFPLKRNAKILCSKRISETNIESDEKCSDVRHRQVNAEASDLDVAQMNEERTKQMSSFHYSQHEFEFDPEEFLGDTPKVEERGNKPDFEKNCELIHQFLETGETNDPWFDDRVHCTIHGIKQALEWLK